MIAAYLMTIAGLLAIVALGVWAENR